MQVTEFYDRVEFHPELEGIGVDSGLNGKASVHVRHTPSGLITNVPLDAIKQASWKDIEPVLVCEREPAVLQHMTRVVGYYSRTENWNKSKIGELKDRHKGVYTLAA